MMKLPAGDKVLDLIDLAYRADQPILLAGRHGVGKSSLFEAAAKRAGIDVIVRDLSLMEPVDLMGIPQVDGQGRTVYRPPQFLPTCGKGLLVFEELNRSPRYMQIPCLQLLTARRLNDYVLQKGWLPGAAINDGEEYLVDDLDVALSSRFLQVQVEADRAAWLEWARRSGAPVCTENDYVRTKKAAFQFKYEPPTTRQPRSVGRRAAATAAQPVGNRECAAPRKTGAGRSRLDVTIQTVAVCGRPSHDWCCG